MNDQDSVEIPNFTHITDEAVSALAKHKGELLDLYILLEISDKAAESLASHRGSGRSHFCGKPFRSCYCCTRNVSRIA